MHQPAVSRWFNWPLTTPEASRTPFGGKRKRPNLCPAALSLVIELPRSGPSGRCAKQRGKVHNAVWLVGAVGGSKPNLPPKPMVSLVYPSVYPKKLDGSETKDWRGL